tara:strand:- start:9799 stop:10440 length:642 start_codon:yes stop_codon:yes gene_type:complete
MAQSGHIVQIFKSRQNILELLGEQGYNINEYEGASINEVNSMYQEKQMDMLLSKPSGKKAYIKYHLANLKGSGGSLRANNIYEYIEDLLNLESILTKSDDLIIIIKDEPNDSLIKILKNIWEQEGVFITVFNMSRLQFNILKHDLVPNHRLLNEAEVKEFKEKYHITDDKQIPDISRFSPVAQVLGMRPTQICKITRPSRTAINSEFYRICSA